MNKRLILSLSIIGVVAAIAVGGTIAYFSDTETSTGNTFTAGSIDLKIASKATYNGEPWEFGTWGQPDGKDIVECDKFFNFTDIKPGDSGENTITFTVLTNDAWMCANVTATSSENTLMESELAVADDGNKGELGDYLEVFWWVDDGDNVYENGEQILYSGPRTVNEWLELGDGSLPLTFADSSWNWITNSSVNPNPVPGNIQQHIGVGWCFGDLQVTETGTTGFNCDGSGNQDNAQSDGLTMDLSFYAVQERNNSDFVCSTWFNE